MQTFSSIMLSILERLAELFPGSNYSTRLESYIESKGVTDAAQLEYYLKEFDTQERKQYL